MSQFQALAAGALLMAACFLCFNAVRPASAMTEGPYQLMHHSNPNASAGVFRLDTASGSISYCYITSGSDLVCTREVR